MYTVFIVAFVCLAAGAALGRAFFRTGIRPEDTFKVTQFDELNASHKELSAQFQQVQQQLLQSQQAVGRAEELSRTLQTQQQEKTALQQKAETLTNELHLLQQEKVQLEERKKALEQMHAEQEKSLRQFMAEQEEKFRALQDKAQNEFGRMTAESVSVLKKQSEEALARTRVDLVSKNADLFGPLKDTMGRFTASLDSFKEGSITRHEELKNALHKTLELNENLSKEAADLATALKAPKAQGCWGELTLEEVLLSAGLQEGREYDKQVCFKTAEEARQLPDFVIHLPHDRHIIIDSKMSINSYLKWSTAHTDEDRRLYMAQHVAAIRKHIAELSSKKYQTLLDKNGLEFVFMFIPIEYAYFMAIKEDATLAKYAKEQGVALVTASNLFSVMQVVEQLWRLERTGKTMNEILRTGAEMHERVERFAERMALLKKAIDSTAQTYEEARKALSGGQGILKSAVKLEELNVKHARTLTPLLAEDNAQSLPK